MSRYQANARCHMHSHLFAVLEVVDAFPDVALPHLLPQQLHRSALKPSARHFVDRQSWRWASEFSVHVASLHRKRAHVSADKRRRVGPKLAPHLGLLHIDLLSPHDSLPVLYQSHRVSVLVLWRVDGHIGGVHRLLPHHGASIWLRLCCKNPSVA